MATGIIYLEADDEITSAAARIRRSESSRVAVVLPYGSRVATSRINFRLLSRDALIHEKRLSVIAPDGATRALAASAGLPVFASVGEYEASLEEPAGDGGAGAELTSPATTAAPGGPVDEEASGSDRPTRSRKRSPGPTPPDAASAAAAAGAAAGAAGAGAAAGGAAGQTATGGAAGQAPTPGPTDPTSRVVLPRPEPRRRPSPRPPHAPEREPEPPIRPTTSIPVIGSRRAIPRTPILLAAAILALATLVTGVGAYVLLPSATVAVTPHEKAVGPLRFSVVADESITEPDAARRLVPAQRLTVDLDVSDTFPATGKRIARTRATGRVTFSSFNPASENTIPSGSIVATEGGIEFRTTRAITLEPAELVQGTPTVIVPSTKNVDVAAVRQGPNGNVPANAIRVVPPGEDPNLTKVRNENPTTGGTREEFPVIEQKDVTAALEALGAQVDIAFEERLADPSIVPEGTTIFPGTAVMGEMTPTVAEEALVGVEEPEFELGLTATGSVVAVNPTPVATIAETLLLAEIAADHELVPGSTAIDPGEPVVDGQTVSFPVVAEARQVSIPDADELEALILGKPLDEARRLLAGYGDVEVTLWPDWVTSVPTIDGRVDVIVRDPVPPGEPAESPDDVDASPAPAESPAASAP